MLPRPIKGKDLIFYRGVWLKDFLSNDDLKAHGVWCYD